MEEYIRARSTVNATLFSSANADNFAYILSQPTQSQSVNDQLSLATQIIRYGAEGDRKHAATLMSAGVLDLLASRLVSLIVNDSESKFLPADVKLPAKLPSDGKGLQGFLPSPPKKMFGPLLEAIRVITSESAYRSARLFYSRDILALFPTVPNFPCESDPAASQEATSVAATANHHWDRLLPQLPQAQTKSEMSFTRQFPSLGAYLPGDMTRVPFTFEQSEQSTPGEVGSDFLKWLIHTTRVSSGEERLSTALLMSSLLNATDLNVHYEKSLALLVVPLIVQIIEELTRHSKAAPDTITSGDVRAPLALALLIDSSSVLQKAAMEANVIKSLCPLLKRSFDPKMTDIGPMWTPYPLGPEEPRAEWDPCYIGPETICQEQLVAFQTRAYTMQALAVIAQKEDETRRTIIDYGVVVSMVEALRPYTIDGVPVNLTGEIEPKEGNPAIVLASALAVLTTLSRSVGILRTSLIDGGIAKPAFKLMQHPNLDVRRAAVDSMVNLILHFSPMREELMELNVLEALCENVHSPDLELRVSALWSLKHLITMSDANVKLSAFDGIGKEFFAQVLSAEGSSQHRLATANARGEKVDLLNDDEPGMDVDTPMASSDEESVEAGGPDRRGLRSKYFLAPEHVARLKPLRNAEQNAAVRARKDDVRIQHHALDFLRNMLADPNAQQPELVDKVLGDLGSEKFFEIIVGKLKPKAGAPGIGGPAGKRPTLTTPGGTTGNAGTQTYIDSSAYHHADILHPALFILVHVANGRPNHRNLVLSQQGLCTTILPLFAHPDAKVRVTCVWLAHNILWIDDVGDDQGPARERAQVMHSAGIFDKCEEACRDADMDTRERARAVVDMFTKLLGETGQP